MKKVTTFDLYSATEIPSQYKVAINALFYHTIAGIPFERMDDMLDLQLETMLEMEYKDVD
jgi:hypothetical protein